MSELSHDEESATPEDMEVILEEIMPLREMRPRLERRVRRVEMSGTNIDFPPIQNGMDYLVSVVELLATSEGAPSARDLKYAVLHLQAASEVLLKARLLREHWSLVFKDPGRATLKKFEDGDFISCETVEAINRLRNIAGVVIDDKDASILEKLTKSRNALQHYGLTTSARAVEARAAQVLDFLLNFVHDELRPQLDMPEAAALDREMEAVQYGLGDIEAFIKTRLNRLRSQMQSHLDITVCCPECNQWTWVIGEGPSSSCRFCHMSYINADYAAFTYLMSYDSAVAWGDGGVHGKCPDCHQLALLGGVILARDPQKSCGFCFGCGSSFEKLRSCSSCGDPFVPSDEETLTCDCCWSRSIAAD